MKKAFGVLFLGLAAGLSGVLAILYKQKSGALDAAQMRITSMERRMSTLAASPVPAEDRAAEVDALRATVASQAAELEELKRRLAEAATATAGFAQRSASTLEAAVADDLASVQAALEQRLSESSAELDELRRRFHAETAWQAKAPALATAARGLEKLPAAKIDFANRANRVESAELIATHVRNRQPRGKW